MHILTYCIVLEITREVKIKQMLTQSKTYRSMQKTSYKTHNTNSEYNLCKKP